MKRIKSRLQAAQNMSLGDRSTRFVVGGVLLAAPLVMGGSGAILAVLALYPLLTATLGWDPLYDVGHVKTCGLSERNQCGTLPYQVDAAMGHHPHPHHNFDHSLDGSDHNK